MLQSCLSQNECSGFGKYCGTVQLSYVMLCEKHKGKK